MPQAIIITDQAITCSFSGVGPKTVRKDSGMFKSILKMIKDKVSDDILINAFSLVTKIRNHVSGIFDIDETGDCYIEGEKLPPSLGKRIVAFANDGLPFEPLVKFWHNVKLNPDPRAKTDLYTFLEHNGHPITEDGCFVAYRAIRNDWMDKKTGTMLNAIGATLSMPREKCDANPNQTCSAGLHVAAYQYARESYGCFGTENSDRLIEVKVNPKDVVAIPTDYNQQKMRVCEFTVLAENKEGVIQRPMYDAATDTSKPSDEFDIDESDAIVSFGGANDNWKGQKRDSKGRFIKA